MPDLGPSVTLELRSQNGKGQFALRGLGGLWLALCNYCLAGLPLSLPIAWGSGVPAPQLFRDGCSLTAGAILGLLAQWRGQPEGH